MIQRIQTFYLLLIAALSATTLFFPLTYLSTTSGDLYDIYIRGIYTASGVKADESIYLLILAVASIALPIITILLFKNRMLQLRMCGIEAVLLIGNCAMIGAYTYLATRAVAEIGVDRVGFHPALFAPLLAIVFCFLAGKAILKDELLVRSVDRIR